MTDMTNIRTRHVVFVSLPTGMVGDKATTERSTARAGTFAAEKLGKVPAQLTLHLVGGVPREAADAYVEQRCGDGASTDFTVAIAETATKAMRGIGPAGEHCVMVYGDDPVGVPTGWAIELLECEQDDGGVYKIYRLTSSGS